MNSSELLDYSAMKLELSPKQNPLWLIKDMVWDMGRIEGGKCHSTQKEGENPTVKI